MKDWKLIFNTKSYHYILVKEIIKENYLKFFFEHKQEIEQNSSFSFLMPEQRDIDNNNTSDYVMRFAPQLKIFMEDPTKVTLFTEEDVIKSIVKEDKRLNFFRYLSKNNKNIVLFHYDDIDKYAKSTGLSYLELSEESLDKQYHLLDSFLNIKTTINKTHNPFKNPILAFNKIKEED